MLWRIVLIDGSGAGRGYSVDFELFHSGLFSRFDAAVWDSDCLLMLAQILDAVLEAAAEQSNINDEKVKLWADHIPEA